MDQTVAFFFYFLGSIPEIMNFDQGSTLAFDYISYDFGGDIVSGAVYEKMKRRHRKKSVRKNDEGKREWALLLARKNHLRGTVEVL